MISLPCDVDGLLINLKVEDTWWMRLRHPGKLEWSNDSDAFHCCVHDGTVPVGRMLEAKRAEAAIIPPMPLSAGISEEVYFLGDGTQELPQPVLLLLTEAKPFREFAHKHSFRCSWLERWD